MGNPSRVRSSSIEDAPVGSIAPVTHGVKDFRGTSAADSRRKFHRGNLIGTGLPGAQAECALCGGTLPEDLLVAAHIKPRSQCSEAERLDIPSIAMTACLLGCDALYEHGYITVSAAGTIQAGKRSGPPTLGNLIGRPVASHVDNRIEYFAWHRSSHQEPPSRTVPALSCWPTSSFAVDVKKHLGNDAMVDEVRLFPSRPETA